MTETIPRLPDDIDGLQALVTSQAATIAEREAALEGGLAGKQVPCREIENGLIDIMP